MLMVLPPSTFKPFINQAIIDSGSGVLEQQVVVSVSIEVEGHAGNDDQFGRFGDGCRGWRRGSGWCRR